jgi:hypothetical protein
MTATPPDPIEPTTDERDRHRLLLWICGGVALVLVIIGLITYNGKNETAQAEDLAQQLTQSLQQAGLPVPEDQDIFVRSFGTDGGAVCDNPASALGRALLFDQLVNGASAVGRRPVIADRRLIQGQALIMQTYCPDKLPQFREKTDELKTDDVIKE